MDTIHVYAVPGAQNIIDTIDPVTNLTSCFGRTAAEVAEREPLAVRMTWDEFLSAAAERQHTTITWMPSSQADYLDMLNVLPPAMWIGGAFLVGEPTDHDMSNGAPRFAAYWERHGAYYVANRPLTRAELREQVKAR